MTIKEYKVQKALGLLTEDTLYELAKAEDTATEILVDIRDSCQFMVGNFSQFIAILNLSRRGIK